MSFGEMDQSLIADFLMESKELVDQLDSDLVELEGDPDPQQRLDAIFRALHTIKGAASFLSMPGVTTFTHAAEDALNKLRKGEAQVTESVVDALLQSVDVLKSQLAEVESGIAPSEGPADLIALLQAIASAEATAGATDAEAGNVPQAGGADDYEPAFGGTCVATDFSSEKLDVLPFMVTDLEESASSLEECIGQLSETERRMQVCSRLTEIADSMFATADYFDLDILKRLIGLVASAGQAIAGLDQDRIDVLAPRMQAVRTLIEASASALADGFIAQWPIETLEARFGAMLSDEETSDDWALPVGESVEHVLAHDGVVTIDASASVASPAATPAQAGSPGQSAAGSRAQESDGTGSGEAARGSSGVEQTIRVEVSRLEHLLNLVGEMVLTKNQVLGLTRQLQGQGVPQDFVESASSISSDLDRLTAELQVGVMRTRMQPLHKLFGRYPRIIRDLAKKTGKKVDLKIIGGDTEVDKSVLEMLGDPLVHMLRNSVDHGVESPSDRVAAGKREVGTIVLSAEHQGGHVRVAIEDDGKGMSRSVIAGKAIEKGVATEEQIAQMSDEEVFKFIFAAGFSTAAEVSDLSGRGVGMDVVRTNVSKLNGDIHIRSKHGEGTSIDIMIPLTVAIMPAMMVGIGRHDYAIPLSSVIEIVRYESEHTHTVAGREVMRLRDAVLPLLDMRTRLGETSGPENHGFSVVIAVGQEKLGLIVDRLVGQQEVVIKPLDDEYTSGGPFSGATIRENGDVSLILDVVKLMRTMETGQYAAV